MTRFVKIKKKVPVKLAKKNTMRKSKPSVLNKVFKDKDLKHMRKRM